MVSGSYGSGCCNSRVRAARHGGHYFHWCPSYYRALLGKRQVFHGPAVRPTRIARRRAEEEGADTLLVGERRRSRRRLPSAIRSDEDCAPLSWTSERAD